MDEKKGSTNRYFKTEGGESGLKGIKELEAFSVSEMEQAIFFLCAELTSKNFDQNLTEKWLNEFRQYFDQYPRLLYSAVSNQIYSHANQFGEISTNLDKVMESAGNYGWFKADENCQNNILYGRGLLKFYDHVNLAYKQQVQLSVNEDELKRQFESFSEPVFTKITKEMTAQLVGLIGLFTALSFLVFGGISSLQGVMDALRTTTQTTQSVLPALIIAIAWAFCMMNLLFGFMYFVIRVTTLPKPVDERAKNVVQRYPVVFLSNYILLALFLIFGFLWFSECNGLGRGILSLFLRFSNSSFICVFVLILLILAILGFALWRQVKQEK